MLKRKWNKLHNFVQKQKPFFNIYVHDLREKIAKLTEDYIKYLDEMEREAMHVILSEEGVKTFRFKDLPKLIRKDNGVYKAWMEVLEHED